MCNAISPERAVMWTVLHQGGVDPRLRAEHFTHESYRQWFALAVELAHQGVSFSEAEFAGRAEAAGRPMDHRDRRALKRMLRVPPPPRVLSNRDLLVQALVDRHLGQRMHIERLIN